MSNALRDVMSPLPSVSLNGSRSVQTGIKFNNDSGLVSSLNGDRNPIQTVIEFVSSTDFDVARTRLVDASRHNGNEIYLLARRSQDVDELVNEAYRCDEIANRYRNETEKEIKDYCKTQKDRAANLLGQIEGKLSRSLINGEFIFGGNATAVEGYDQKLLDACKKHLLDAAKQVFDRYQEAPVQVNTNVAEKFIRADNLSLITADIDPLTLVEKTGGTFSINESHQAITSIKDYIETRGGIDGKVLSDYFSRPPFGWSQDTLRYLVAAMFVGGLVKFKVAGQELTSSGQKAIEAIKTNNTFKNVGVNLRDDRPSPEMCMLASERLTELAGDSVFPMEDDISKAAVRYFNKAQHEFGSLASELRNLNIPGEDKAKSLSNDLASMLLSDCSDAPQRLGAEESQVFKSLQWATAIQQSFKQGLDNTLKSLGNLINSINTLPDSGIPGQLKQSANEEIEVFNEKIKMSDFYEHSADFNSTLTSLNTLISSSVEELQKQQEQSIEQAQTEVANHIDWNELTVDEKSQELSRFDSLALTVTKDISGLKALIAQEFNISQKLKEVNNSVSHKAQAKRAQRIAEEKAKYEAEGKADQKIERRLTIPKRVTQKAELEQLIQMLQQLKGDLELNSEIEIHIDFES